MAISDDLERLAAVLLTDALSASPPPGTDRLAIFKAISTYRIGITRATRGQEDEETGESFDAMRRKGLEALETKGST